MKRKIPLLLLCLLFLCVFLYSGFQILSILREYRVSEQTYEALTEFIQIPETTQPNTVEESKQSSGLLPEQTQPAEKENLWPIVDFDALQDINPDVVAWIYIEGTRINYPVVRGEDNDKYLYQLFDGTYNSSGSIFMDYRNQRDFSDRHTILYGHHTSGEGMFSWVYEYVAQDYSKKYPSCLVLTPEGNYRLEFFAGYVDAPSADAWRLDFSSDEDFGLWLEQSAEKSAFTSAVIPTSQDRVVTFSTCAYDFEDARCVLLGILKPQP